MKYLLDTNIVSELRKPRPHGGVSAWTQDQPANSFAIPSIVIFELQIGIGKLRRQDSERAISFEMWVDRILSTSTVLSLDATAAREAARMMDRQSMELLADAMIAAIARVNGLTVATRNVKDFRVFGVPLVNPFDYKP